MAYVIENAYILKDNQLKKDSLLINENRVAALGFNHNKSRYMKMNLQSFIMTPTYVLFNSDVRLLGSFQNLKKYMIENFLLSGCTTILTYVDVFSEKELTKKVSELKTKLLSSPVDFLIAVRIQLSLLTPSFIRKCKIENIPGIIVEITNIKALETVPWGWIKDALFPYNCPLIPNFSEPLKNQAKNVLSSWKKIMEKENLPAIYEELKENVPLTAPILNRIGVFPDRSCLVQGSELSYNLYLKHGEIKNLDVKQLFLYHRDILVITVHKGKVIRAGKEVQFKPGYGEYVKVKTPSYYSNYSS
jgi:hypothetical protein